MSKRKGQYEIEEEEYISEAVIGRDPDSSSRRENKKKIRDNPNRKIDPKRIKDDRRGKGKRRKWE